MVVLPKSPHKLERGDSMEKKIEYAATYHFGKTTVHIVAPPPLTDAEKERILNEFHIAGWNIIEEIERRKEQENRLSL